MASEPDDITRWQRIDRDVTTSGWLLADDLDRLSAIGVRHVINLALASHPAALPDEGAQLAERGIGYDHIPIPFDAPQEDHFARFCAAFEAAPRPVHVHCIANWRVSALLYRWQRDHGGMEENAARALMERQWSPETHDHPDAPAWARLIAGSVETPLASD